jgi:quercetin dioxygenase-like cupin family protein
MSRPAKDKAAVSQDRAYQFIAQAADALEAIPPDSIVSRTLHNDPVVKVILFGFAPGQELSEHTSARRAMLQFLSGRAQVVLGADTFEAQAGTFVYMQPHLTHSVTAYEETHMLLIQVADPS